MTKFTGLTALETSQFLNMERSWVYLALQKLEPGYKVKGEIRPDLIFKLFDFAFSTRKLDSLNYTALGGIGLAQVKENYTQALTEVKKVEDLLPLIVARKIFRSETVISNILVYIRRIRPDLEKEARNLFPEYIKKLAYKKFIQGKLNFSFFIRGGQVFAAQWEHAIDFIKKEIKKAI